MCRTVGGSAARGCWGAFTAPLGEAYPGPRRPGVVCVTPVRCFWGVRGAPSCGSRACCAQGARRPGVVWVPIRACTGSLCGVPAGDCAAGRPPSLLLRCRLRGGLSLGAYGTCGGWASGAVWGSHCGRRPVFGASYLRRPAVSGLGERYRRRSSGPRRSRPGPGADPGGLRRER